MSPQRVAFLTALSVTAFAGNSLICRFALRQTNIDAASYTTVRLISGAAMLWIVARGKRSAQPSSGNWISAFALFAYAAFFTYAYVSLPAGTGALLLLGAVQATMIGYGIATGERLHAIQIAGLLLAFAGLVYFLLPGISAPPWRGSLIMFGAGIAWGTYSLRGRGQQDPLAVTAGNFLRAAPIALAISLLAWKHTFLDLPGLGYALVSGAITSGLAYACWYSVLPMLKATNAATVQLTVPVLTALGGIAFLGEPLTLRVVLASAAILGGIALVVLNG